MPKLKQQYEFAVIATDTVIFRVIDGALSVVLIEMKKEPFLNHWAVPGGLVNPEEDIDQAAERILLTKAGISNVYLEQLYTFGKVDRDPFGRVVSVAYMALTADSRLKISTTAEYGGIAWFNVKHLPKLAYDHQEVIKTAIERLKSKLTYTNIVYTLLPTEFTLGELQAVYETILDHKIDKRNFRKKLFSLKIVKKLNKKKLTGPNRPAELFTFVSHKPALVDIL
jgi:8-oxo-dGTP diphosphatase